MIEATASTITEPARPAVRSSSGLERIRKAWRAGYSSGRYERRYQRSPDDRYMMRCPYSSYWPGVQCRIAWRTGYRMAFGVDPELKDVTRRLYAL